MDKLTILWADDEIDLLKPHIMFLEEKGYEVIAVTSGDEALDELTRNHIDPPKLPQLRCVHSRAEILPDGLFQETAGNLPQNSKLQPHPHKPAHIHLLVSPSIALRSQELCRIRPKRFPQIPCQADSMPLTFGQGAKKRQPNKSAAVTVCRLFLFPLNAADVFLCLVAGCHHFMTAPKAFQSKVCTGAQYLPSFFTAGVRFFHNQNVVQLDIQHLHLLLDTVPILFC